jgi:hypothetical protein
MPPEGNLKRFRSILIAVLLVLAPATIQADDSFSFRLAPGPRLVGTRASSSGSGAISARLSGDTLRLDGRYQGLLGVPSAARLLMGEAPGVRGSAIADLAVSPARDGTISGSMRLNEEQRAAFRKGALYVEIDSADAPEGDLWGWVMPALK